MKKKKSMDEKDYHAKKRNQIKTNNLMMKKKFHEEQQSHFDLSDYSSSDDQSYRIERNPKTAKTDGPNLSSSHVSQLLAEIKSLKSENEKLQLH